MHGIISELRVLLAILLFAGAFACQQQSSLAAMDRLLLTSWQSYRQHFISPEGRVIIPERDGGTISEAQAYALLRSVWARDEATFARVYAWTYLNLSRVKSHGDSLLSWLWGRKSDGSWGVLDANTATDADLDYALALLLAARRGWRAPPGFPDYRQEAGRVREDIWAREVVLLANGEALLTPGNWHEAEAPYLVNPSYFSPAAYRLFGSAQDRQEDWQSAVVRDSKFPSPLRGEGQGGGENSLPRSRPREGRGAVTARPDWQQLHKSAYTLLASLNQGLKNQPGVGLFPDWCRVDAAGRVAAAPGRDTRFGWEAVRLPFRLALDFLWFGEVRAADLLRQKFLPFFHKEWQAHHRLAAVYNFDGTPAVDYESPVLYAGVLAAALTCGDRDLARDLSQKILSFCRQENGRVYFEAPNHYYANNWAWLGLALYAGWTKPFTE